MVSSSQPRMLADTRLEAGRNPTRVLIALSSPMDCQLLLTALGQSRHRLEPVASAVSRTEIIQCLSRGNVDVALINADLEDGELAGLEVLSEIQASYRETSVVTLFNTWNDDLIVHAFRAGAMGVFCRSERKLDMLWKCIEAVHKGQVWANSVQLQLLLRALRKTPPMQVAPSRGRSLLTQRETQVAMLAAEGLLNKGIALKLGITEHTVSNYLFRIYNKLGISSRVELVLVLMKRPDIHRSAS
jgi:two-component system nitrate/nitrite response regulator NarL